MNIYQCVLISGWERLQRMVQRRSSVFDGHMNEVMKETIAHGVPSVVHLVSYTCKTTEPGAVFDNALA